MEVKLVLTDVPKVFDHSSKALESLWCRQDEGEGALQACQSSTLQAQHRAMSRGQLGDRAALE